MIKSLVKTKRKVLLLAAAMLLVVGAGCKKEPSASFSQASVAAGVAAAQVSFQERKELATKLTSLSGTQMWGVYTKQDLLEGDLLSEYLFPKEKDSFGKAWVSANFGQANLVFARFNTLSSYPETPYYGRLVMHAFSKESGHHWSSDGAWKINEEGLLVISKVSEAFMHKHALYDINGQYCIEFYDDNLRLSKIHPTSGYCNPIGRITYQVIDRP